MKNDMSYTDKIWRRKNKRCHYIYLSYKSQWLCM